jgi:hypothetical protein
MTIYKQNTGISTAQNPQGHAPQQQCAQQHRASVFDAERFSYIIASAAAWNREAMTVAAIINISVIISPSLPSIANIPMTSPLLIEDATVRT